MSRSALEDYFLCFIEDFRETFLRAELVAPKLDFVNSHIIFVIKISSFQKNNICGVLEVITAFLLDTQFL